MSTVVRIEGDMTIYRAEELKPMFFPLPAGQADIEIELSAVSEIDTTGVQLLLLARREARATGRAISLVDPSPAVCEALDLLDLREQFDPATGASARAA